ncbi:hypothetical protein BCR37DRAFT_228964 [Protomyces lactucae-debilis]|uniref:Rhodopsin domain-containing protein n=1 Tax=Protomyces lactucae-debilis TaxID=2754530 RepID=A0A1Y2EQS1_PROLT|nr:uncharacterized protein BCR37DRAFT_228964 [Protomyces lactucae-debilis]ORY73898.1 hypothetical protein BCR37DRAFT_228964 [Protomyces lactucae-debilis]
MNALHNLTALLNTTDAMAPWSARRAIHGTGGGFQEKDTISANSDDEDSAGIPALVKRSLIVFTVLCAFSFAAVVLRLHHRRKRLKKLGSDDYLISLAWLLAALVGVLSHYRDAQGFGQETPTFDELSSIFKQQFVYMHAFYISLALTQVSVAINYRRLSQGLIRWHTIVCNILLCYIVVGSLVEILAYDLQCRPIPAFWRLQDRPSANCYGKTTTATLVIYGPPLFRITADIALMILPMPVISMLQLPKAQKAAVVAVLLLTLVVILANLKRLSLTEPNQDTTVTRFLTVTLPLVQIWSSVEVHAAILCACGVTLRAPFVESWQKLRARVQSEALYPNLPFMKRRDRQQSASTMDSQESADSIGIAKLALAHAQSRTAISQAPEHQISMEQMLVQA